VNLSENQISSATCFFSLSIVLLDQHFF